MGYDIKKWMTIAEDLSKTLTVEPVSGSRKLLQIKGFSEVTFPILQKVFVQNENGELVIHGEIQPGILLYYPHDGRHRDIDVKFRYYPQDNALELLGYDQSVYEMAEDIAVEDGWDETDKDQILAIKKEIEIEIDRATPIVYSIANEIHNQLGTTFSEIDAHRTTPSDSLLDISESANQSFEVRPHLNKSLAVIYRGLEIPDGMFILFPNNQLRGHFEYRGEYTKPNVPYPLEDYDETEDIEFTVDFETGKIIDFDLSEETNMVRFDYLQRIAETILENEGADYPPDTNEYDEEVSHLAENLYGGFEDIKEDLYEYVDEFLEEIRDVIGSSYDEIEAHRSTPFDSLLSISESQITVLPNSNKDVFRIEAPYGDFEITKGQYDGLHVKGTMVGDFLENRLEFEEYEIILDVSFFIDSDGSLSVEYIKTNEEDMLDTITEIADYAFFDDNPNVEDDSDEYEDRIKSYRKYYYDNTIVDKEKIEDEVIEPLAELIRKELGTSFIDIEAHRKHPNDSLLDLSESYDINIYDMKNGKIDFSVDGKHYSIHQQHNIVTETGISGSVEFDVIIENKFASVVIGDFKAEYSAILETGEIDEQAIDDAIHSEFENDDDHLRHLASKMDDEDLKRLGVDVNDMGEVLDLLYEITDIVYIENALEAIRKDISSIRDRFGSTFDEVAHNLEAYRSSPSDSLLFISESQLTVLGSPRSNRLDVKTPYGEFTLAKSGDHEDKPHLEMLIDGVVHGGFLWNSLDLTYEDIDVHVYVVIDPEGTITYSDNTLRDRSDVTKIVSSLAHEALMDENPNVEVDSDEYRENIQDYKDDYFDSIGFAKNKLIREVVEPLAKLVASEFDTLLDDMESRRKDPSDSLLSISESQITVLPGRGRDYHIRTSYGNFDISKYYENGLLVEAEIHGDYFKDFGSGAYYDIDIELSFTIDSDGNVSGIRIAPDEDDQREIVNNLAYEAFGYENPEVDDDSDEFWNHIHEYEEYYYDRTGVDEDKVMYDIIEPLAELIVKELGTSFDELEAKRSDTKDSLLSLSESSVTVLPSNLYEKGVILKTPVGEFTATDGGRDNLIIDGDVHGDFLEDKFTGTNYLTDVYIHFVIDSNGNITDEEIDQDYLFHDEFLDGIAHDPFQQKYPNLDEDDYDYHTLFDEFKYDYNRKYISVDEDRVIKEIVNPLAKLIMKELGTSFDELEAKRSGTRDSLLSISESQIKLFKRQFGGFSIDTPYGYFEIDSDDHGGIQVSGDVYHDFIVDRIANTTYEAEATITFIIDRDGELDHSNIDIDVDYESEREAIGDAIRREFDNDYPDLDPDSTEYEDLLYGFADNYYNYVNIDTGAIIDEIIEPLANLIVREIGSVFDDMEAHRKHPSDSLLNISESVDRYGRSFKVSPTNKPETLEVHYKNFLSSSEYGQFFISSGGRFDGCIYYRGHYEYGGYNEIEEIDFTADFYTGRLKWHDISEGTVMQRYDFLLDKAYDIVVRDYPELDPDSDEFHEEVSYVQANLYSNFHELDNSEIEKLVDEFLEEVRDVIGATYDDIDEHRDAPRDSLLDISESAEPDIREIDNNIFQILAPGMGRYIIDNNSKEGTTISGDITVDVTVSNIHVFNDIKREDEIGYQANLDTEEVYITETYTSTLEIFEDTFVFSDEFLEEQGVDPEDIDEISDFLYDTSTIEYPTESEIENLVKQDIREFKQRFGHSFDEIESKRTQPKDSILNIEESSNPMRRLINIIERASK